MCDEATSALDPKTTHSILELIKDINRKLGITVIVITHQMSVVEEICNRVAILDNGVVVEDGEVSEIFASPRSDAARRLVFPEGFDKKSMESYSTEPRIRLVFNGAVSANNPLIATMAAQKGIYANIMAASTKMIGEKLYGSMILGIAGGAEKFNEALAYLSGLENITAEEVRSDV